MMQALLIHNNLIDKAKWACFGYVIEQEGGERLREEGDNLNLIELPTRTETTDTRALPFRFLFHHV